MYIVYYSPLNLLDIGQLLLLLFYPKIRLYFHYDPYTKRLKQDISDIRNYIGISLSSLLSKLFDSCIISLNTVVFKSDDLQFAYKKLLFYYTMSFYGYLTLLDLR